MGETCVLTLYYPKSFLKLPESTVSAATILAEAGSRISNLQDELLLLDSKYIPIAADDNTG